MSNRNARRDQDGIFKVPMKVGNITVVNFGNIKIDDAAYHTAEFIYPVGFMCA